MEKKALIRILLILSCLVFSAAVPATRSFAISKMDPSVQDHQANKEGAITEISRMMMDTTADYPGTRPNPSHNPKSPGKP